MTNVSLETRACLSEALRVLPDEFPRDERNRHPHFVGFVQFCLDRHMMFRQLRQTMQDDVGAAMDNRLSTQKHAAQLSRLSGTMVSPLHGHHQIKDAHYIPVLTRMEPTLSRGFDILDNDHHALDALYRRCKCRVAGAG